MELQISVITLAVSDMQRAIQFYRDGIGLSMRDDKPPVAYFQLNGTWLALLPRDALARYAHVAPDGHGFTGVTLSCNVSSRQAVDRTIEQAQAAGAAVVNQPAELGWGGYAGWFADPDGHLWEIVWNPRPFMD
ncbi:MAG: VOC family protein [bacterium]|nr:VOC family protein [bacterium]